MREFYRQTFAKAGALAYIGEGAAHIYFLITGARLADIPFAADWYFATLGTYCSIGLLMYAYTCKLERRRCCDTWAYVVTTLMTVGPVALHICIIVAHSHEILKIFPWAYSFFGLTYCIFFTYWLSTLRLKRP
jgi:hypothetical protein